MANIGTQWLLDLSTVIGGRVPSEEVSDGFQNLLPSCGDSILIIGAESDREPLVDFRLRL